MATLCSLCSLQKQSAQCWAGELCLCFHPLLGVVNSLRTIRVVKASSGSELWMEWDRSGTGGRWGKMVGGGKEELKLVCKMGKKNLFN